jgi:hypothetical protein
VIDRQPEPLTAEDLARLAITYRRASNARRWWLWRLVFALRQGLPAEIARRVAGPEPPK